MSDKINMVQAINWAMDDAMAEDKKVLVLGEDVADHTGGGVVGITKGLSDKYGRERVVATPISETAFTGAAIGAAMMGFKPIVEIMLMNFMTVCSDMIVNHAAKLRFMSGGQTSVPMVIRTMTGPGMGSGGQHSDFMEVWYAHTAGLKVVIPSTPDDAYGLMRPHIDAGRIKPLAVISADRFPLYPDIMGMKESGFPDFDYNSYQGLSAPAGTPRAIIDRLNAAAHVAIQAQSVKDHFQKVGIVLQGGTPEEYQGIINREVAAFAKVIRESNITIE